MAALDPRWSRSSMTPSQVSAHQHHGPTRKGDVGAARRGTAMNVRRRGGRGGDDGDRPGFDAAEPLGWAKLARASAGPPIRTILASAAMRNSSRVRQNAGHAALADSPSPWGCRSGISDDAGRTHAAAERFLEASKFRRLPASLGRVTHPVTPGRPRRGTAAGIRRDARVPVGTRPSRAWRPPARR